MRLEKILLLNKFDHSKIVTSSSIFDKKNISLSIDGQIMEQKKFADDSLFSKRIFGDMDSEEDYACSCGKLHGKFYEGTICQKCGTPVEFIGLNINKYRMDRPFFIYI